MRTQPHIKVTAKSIHVTSTDSSPTTVFVASVHIDTTQPERCPQGVWPFVSINSFWLKIQDWKVWLPSLGTKAFAPGAWKPDFMSIQSLQWKRNSATQEPYSADFLNIERGCRYYTDQKKKKKCTLPMGHLNDCVSMCCSVVELLTRNRILSSSFIQHCSSPAAAWAALGATENAGDPTGNFRFSRITQQHLSNTTATSRWFRFIRPCYIPFSAILFFAKLGFPPLLQ